MGKRKRSKGSPGKENAGKSGGSRNSIADDRGVAQQTKAPKGSRKDQTEANDTMAISAHVRRNYRSTWDEADDTKLAQLVHTHGDDWTTIASCYEDRTHQQVQHRWLKVLDPSVRKGPWTDEEDTTLRRVVNSLGQSRWNTVAESLPGRLGKQCRERWVNHLDPSVKKGDWTAAEDASIARLYREHGSQWKLMTAELPGRTDNAIKNRFHSTIKKNVDELMEGRHRYRPRKATCASPDTDWLGLAEVVDEADIRRSKRQCKAPTMMEGMEMTVLSPEPASESDGDAQLPPSKWKPGTVRFVSKRAHTKESPHKGEEETPPPTKAAAVLPTKPFVVGKRSNGGKEGVTKPKTRRVRWAQAEIPARRVRRGRSLRDEEENSNEESPPIEKMPANDSLLSKSALGLRRPPLPPASRKPTDQQTNWNGFVTYQAMCADGSIPNGGSPMPECAGKIPSWAARAATSPEIPLFNAGFSILPQPDSALATALACQTVGHNLFNGDQPDDIAKALGWDSVPDWMPCGNDDDVAENRVPSGDAGNAAAAVIASFKATPMDSTARPPLRALAEFTSSAGLQTVGTTVGSVGPLIKNAISSGEDDSPDMEWGFWPQKGSTPPPSDLELGLSPLGTWAPPDTSAREGSNPFMFSPFKSGTKCMRLNMGTPSSKGAPFT